VRRESDSEMRQNGKIWKLFSPSDNFHLILL
jgi:hypothetical protein